MLLRALLRSLAEALPPPRIIFDRAGVSKYLSRWYLFGAPTMPDGSHPFDPDGSPKVGIQEPERPFAVFLHKFHRGDDDLELHNHPWTWAIAIVLSGGYREEWRRGSPEGGGAVHLRDVRPLSVNVIHHDTFHRVTLLSEESWSLFIAGPREKDWGFWNRGTGVFTQWRAFITRKRDPTAFLHDKAPPDRDNTFYAICLSCNGVVRVGGSAKPVKTPSREDPSGEVTIDYVCAPCQHEQDHCEPGEPLVGVDVFVDEGNCTVEGDDCKTCDDRKKRAELGDMACHRAVTFT